MPRYPKTQQFWTRCEKQDDLEIVRNLKHLSECSRNGLEELLLRRLAKNSELRKQIGRLFGEAVENLSVVRLVEILRDHRDALVDILRNHPDLLEYVLQRLLRDHRDALVDILRSHPDLLEYVLQRLRP
jgi:hypothetical protein